MSFEQRLIHFTGTLLIWVCAVLVLLSAGAWLSKMPWWNLRSVRIAAPVERVQESSLQLVLAKSVRGNFLNANLLEIREQLAQVPWVRAVQVKRLWPNRLQVDIEEHQPFAFWGERQMLNSFGEVFDANQLELTPESLPRLDGPLGSQAKVIANYKRFRDLFAQHQSKLVALSLAPISNWFITLDNGTKLIMLDEAPELMVKTLERYFKLLPAIQKQYANKPIQRVDLRYPNGFAMALTGMSLQRNATAAAKPDQAQKP